MAGIYIHVPFCRGKCPYCDFYSLTELKSGAYVSAVCDELAARRRIAEFVPAEGEIKADTVYFGGGTPSLLSPAEVGRIMSAVKTAFPVKEKAEITLEANPSLPNPGEYFSEIAACGINRVSLGLQSAVDSERKALGRRAGIKEVNGCIAALRQSGIKNISLDLMLGIPGQTAESLKTSLDFVLSCGVPHISVYMLKIEPNTYFYKNLSKLDLPDEDSVADMYLQTAEYLTAEGFEHYEISNFALPGMRSRHNSGYWTGADYIGIGPAAHSCYEGKRFYFTRSLDDFINGKAAVYDGEAGGADEYIMLGLRTADGIDMDFVSEKYGGDREKIFSYTAALQKNGLARTEGGRLSLTARGYLVSNSVISGFLNLL